MSADGSAEAERRADSTTSGIETSCSSQKRAREEIREWARAYLRSIWERDP